MTALTPEIEMALRVLPRLLGSADIPLVTDEIPSTGMDVFRGDVFGVGG